MNVERFVIKPTIWKFTNDWMISQLQRMWKDLAKNAQFENSQMIEWLGWMWKDLANNTSFENSQMIGWLRWIWKDSANNASIENSQMIIWQISCDECGKICRKTTLSVDVVKTSTVLCARRAQPRPSFWIRTPCEALNPLRIQPFMTLQGLEITLCQNHNQKYIRSMFLIAQVTCTLEQEIPPMRSEDTTSTANTLLR